MQEILLEWYNNSILVDWYVRIIFFFFEVPVFLYLSHNLIVTSHNKTVQGEECQGELYWQIKIGGKQKILWIQFVGEYDFYINKIGSKYTKQGKIGDLCNYTWSLKIFMMIWLLLPSFDTIRISWKLSPSALWPPASSSLGCKLLDVSIHSYSV